MKNLICSSSTSLVPYVGGGPNVGGLPIGAGGTA